MLEQVSSIACLKRDFSWRSMHTPSKLIVRRLIRKAIHLGFRQASLQPDHAAYLQLLSPIVYVYV